MAIEIVDLPIKNGDGLIIISYLGVAKNGLYPAIHGNFNDVWGQWLLVGGFKHDFYFPCHMGCHPSHWLSYFSEGWLNHQPDHNILNVGKIIMDILDVEI